MPKTVSTSIASSCPLYAKNADIDLDIKPVSFACELFTVLERGRRAHLSIARFTQEKGAASSFYKVVDTLAVVLEKRDLLVKDSKRRREMQKCLVD